MLARFEHSENNLFLFWLVLVLVYGNMVTAAIMSSATRPDDLSLLLLLVRDVTCCQCCGFGVEKESQCRYGHDDFKQKVFRGKWSFPQPQKTKVEGS